MTRMVVHPFLASELCPFDYCRKNNLIAHLFSQDDVLGTSMSVSPLKV